MTARGAVSRLKEQGRPVRIKEGGNPELVNTYTQTPQESVSSCIMELLFDKEVFDKRFIINSSQ